MYVARVAVLVVGCAICLPALAEQRFYQFIDAQGHVQTVEAPVSEPVTPSKQDSNPVVKADDAVTSPEARGSSGKSPTPEPISDSIEPAEEEYLDSEVLERNDFNPTGKKRFYILEDGVGSRVEESSGPLTGMTPDAALPAQESVTEPRIGLQDAVSELHEPAEMRRLLGDAPLCADRKSLGAIVNLSVGGSLSASVDPKAWYFLGKGGALMRARIPGEGLRKLKVASYSRMRRNPEFFMPTVAFVNEEGCMVRMLSDGYFEWQYAETKTRQARVEGSLIMLSGERYVFVLLPDAGPAGQSEKTVTRAGDFTIEYKR